MAFTSFVFLCVLILIVRRPNRPPSAAAKLETPAAQATPGASPLILRLASITRQTDDAKTLRFIVPDGRRLQARPGQFLIFSFLFDGKKIAR